MFLLSLFPGIGLLDKGFEQEGFCVVRGPDLIFGGDIRHFQPPAHKFDGVIGGPPCQQFSGANRTGKADLGMEMVNEFVRVVTAAAPAWWLMENVGGIPDVKIDGYSWQRLDLRANEFGLAQSRRRYIQFGHRDGLVLSVERCQPVAATEAICLASEGTRPDRRSWADFCALQGVEAAAMELPYFTQSARYAAVGNGVPVPMATALARGIKQLRADIRVCACGCGRVVGGRKVTATAACRKRQQRRRMLGEPV